MSDQDIERRIARDIAKWQRGVRDKGEPLQIDEGWLHTPQGLRSVSYTHLTLPTTPYV